MPPTSTAPRIRDEWSRLLQTGVRRSEPLYTLLGQNFNVSLANLRGMLHEQCTVEKFCPFGFWNTGGESHCAHFVCHVLGVRPMDPLNVDCVEAVANAEWDKLSPKERRAKESRPVTSAGIGDRADGVCVRANDLANDLCAELAPWDKRPERLTTCLAFFVASDNWETRDGRPFIKGGDKHVGIFVDGQVCHFSNSKKRAFIQPVAALDHMYGRGSTDVFYGTLPERDWMYTG